MQDHYVVVDGVVAQVWRGMAPAYIQSGLRSAPAGTVFPGMLAPAGRALLVSPVAAVTEDDVKRECRRRILIAYPSGKQLSVLRLGGVDRATMDGVIDGLRAAARALRAMAPIPADYRADHYWNVQAEPPVAVAPTQSQPVSQSSPVAPAPASAPIVVNVTTNGAPTSAVSSSSPAAQPSPTPLVIPPQVIYPPIGPSHTAPAPSGALGQLPPELAGVTATQAPGGTADEDANPAERIIRTARAVQKAIWTDADEIAAEAAARGAKDHQPSLDLLAPLAAAAGQSIDEFRDAILLRRASAHHKIVAIDSLQQSALQALSLATSLDEVNSVISSFNDALGGVGA